MAATWAADAGIALDPRAEVPIGVQLGWSIRAAVAAGRLSPGERLPALRDLAAELGVNHNTLRAAVARLEADGVLDRRHGSGTFVAAGAPAAGPDGRVVADAARAAADAGLSPRDLAAALYVHDDAPPAADRDAAERRRLREDIATLERLLAELEPPMAQRPVAPPGRPRTGARLLSLADLRAQRTALVRRIAEVQRRLDEDAAPPPQSPAAAPGKAPARRPRRAPVPRPQTS